MLMGGPPDRSGMSRAATVALPALALCALSGGSAASAQIFVDGPRDVAGARPQPEYDAQGVNAGGFRIYPTIDTGVRYDSNVFSRASNVESDGVVIVTPAIRVLTERGDHRAELSAKATINRYVDLSSQNRENYGVSFRLGGPVDGATDYFLTASYENRATLRGTVENDLTFGEPVVISGVDAAAGLTRQFGRMRATLRGSADQDDYASIETELGPVDQNFRDRWAYTGNLDLGYDLSANLAVFATGRVVRFEFADANPLTNRDATLSSGLIGFRYNITDLITSELGAGYRRNEFDNDNFSNFEGLALSGNISWHPTPLLSFRLKADQSTTTSAFNQVEAVTVSAASASADYEVLRNLVATASVEVARESFENFNEAAGRYSVTLGAQYKINRNAGLRLQADYRNRSELESAPQIGGAEGYSVGLFVVLGL